MVPFSDIEGLHPAILDQRWLAADYFLNNLAALSPAAVQVILRTHPILLYRSRPSAKFLVVGGLRAWQIGSAVNAGQSSPIEVPALILSAIDEDQVVADARIELYLGDLTFCLKPATAARQLASLWTELNGSDPSELARLTPDFTSQAKLIAGLGYASRSAFRSTRLTTAEEDPAKPSPDAPSLRTPEDEPPA